MPEYTVRDPVSGRTLVLKGDSPPTEQELETIFQQVSGSPPAAPARMPYGPPEVPPPAPPTRPPGLPNLDDDPAQQERAQLGLGVQKGVANTVIGLGEAAYRYVPGVAPVVDVTRRAIFGDTIPPAAQAFAAGRAAVQPTTPAEQLGFTAEQIAEFFAPVGVAGKVGKAAEILKAGGLGLAQSGDPTTGAVSAGLTAVVPGAGAARRAAGILARRADKAMVGALGPTKEWAKAEAARIAPDLVARGVKGSREAMLQQARTMTTRVGADIATEIRTAAAAGETVSGAKILTVLDDASQGLLVSMPGGGTLPIAGTEPVLRQLRKLRTFVDQLGPDIPFDTAAKIKTTWDRIVSKAGLYGPKAQASATDSAAGWSIREAAGAFRDLLAKGNPTLADLNQEYALWKGLRSVLTETERRTQSHGIGLTAGVTGGAGVIGGLVSGEGAQDKLQNALLYGVVGGQLTRLLQSPSWATRVSVPLKHALADALASGSAPRVTSAVQRIVAALPAQLRPAAVP